MRHNLPPSDQQTAAEAISQPADVNEFDSFEDYLAQRSSADERAWQRQQEDLTHSLADKYSDIDANENIRTASIKAIEAYQQYYKVEERRQKGETVSAQELQDAEDARTQYQEITSLAYTQLTEQPDGQANFQKFFGDIQAMVESHPENSVDMLSAPEVEDSSEVEADYETDADYEFLYDYDEVVAAVEAVIQAAKHENSPNGPGGYSEDKDEYGPTITEPLMTPEFASQATAELAAAVPLNYEPFNWYDNDMHNTDIEYDRDTGAVVGLTSQAFSKMLDEPAMAAVKDMTSQHPDPRRWINATGDGFGARAKRTLGWLHPRNYAAYWNAIRPVRINGKSLNVSANQPLPRHDIESKLSQLQGNLVEEEENLDKLGDKALAMGLKASLPGRLKRTVDVVMSRNDEFYKARQQAQKQLVKRALQQGNAAAVYAARRAIATDSKVSRVYSRRKLDATYGELYRDIQAHGQEQA